MPNELIEQVRALMRQGYPESNSYAIAVENYKRKHGHAPRMHGKIVKEGIPKNPNEGFRQSANVNERQAQVLRESNNNQNPNFAMPEVVQLRTLEVLLEIRDLLKKQQ